MAIFLPIIKLRNYRISGTVGDDDDDKQKGAIITDESVILLGR